MAIEFNCPHCGSVLQVPDESAGKSALCPKCEQVSSVPDAANHPPDRGQIPPGNPPQPTPLQPTSPQSRPNPSPHLESANPFAPPPSSRQSPVDPTYGTGTMTVTPVQAGDVLNYATMIWKNNLGVLIGAAVIIVLFSAFFSGISSGISGLIKQGGNQEMAAAVGVGLSLLDNAIQLFLNIGMTKLTLSLCRGRGGTIGTLFSGGDRFLPILGTGIIAFVAVAIGFLMLIVPGILLLLFFWPYYYLIVDRQCPAMESFSAAYEIAKPNAGNTVLIWLLTMAIGIIGFLAFCVGIFAAIPLISVLWSTSYLMMRGELAPQPVR